MPAARPIADTGQQDAAEALEWQRLDLWLWHARLLRQRADCTRLAASGQVRINRQPTDKPHARLRPGHVLTLALHGEVRVLRVLALAARRGPPAAARALYEELDAPAAAQGVAAPAPAPLPCTAGES